MSIDYWVSFDIRFFLFNYVFIINDFICVGLNFPYLCKLYYQIVAH